jgi:NAD(P)-dependent dehydrogenase (short-subunit alcohol dehydrogenase family)
MASSHVFIVGGKSGIGLAVAAKLKSPGYLSTAATSSGRHDATAVLG